MLKKSHWKVLFVFSLLAIFVILSFGQEDVKYTPLKEITNDVLGEELHIKAKVTGVNKPDPTSKRPFKFNISDESGTSVMFMWRDQYEGFGNEDAIKKGDKFTAKVTVTEYREKIELRLNRASDIKIEKTAEKKESPVAEKEPKKEVKKEGGYTNIGDINNDYLGEVVKVKGKFTSVGTPWKDTAPYICMLKDDTGIVQVVFWSDVFDALEVEVKDLKNAEVEVESVVNEYRGTIQIKVNHPDAIKILKKGSE